MQNLKTYIIIFITALMIQACGGESITVTSKQIVSITTLAGETKEWQKNPTSEKTWYEAKDFCKNSTLEGIDNWRLPSSREFFELIENNKSIDQNFPEESHIKEFWSATETSFDTKKAWKISAWSNSEAYAYKSKKFGVRCVSSLTPPLSHTFSQKDGNITDIDPNTNIQLLWQDEIDNKTKILTFQEAKSYCEGHGSRLPTIFELQNTVDKEKLSTTNFSNIGSNFTAYWSSTPLPINTNSFLTLNFATGGVSSNDKNSINYIRCVKTIDTTPPTINLKGDNPQIIEIGTAYRELNATAEDNVDGDISDKIDINSSAVDINLIGDYNVTYNVSDKEGNEAITKIRTIKITETSTFIPHLITQNAINSEWIEMADMDNDGDLDILSASRGGSQVAWYENLGNDLNFTERNISTSLGAVTSIRAADMNRDNYLDIIYTLPDEESNSIIKCINNQNKTFTCDHLRAENNTQINTTNNSNAMILIDINSQGNGYPDIIATSSTEDRIDWYHQWSGGIFEPQLVGDNITNATSIDYGRFNNDIHVDIVVASNNRILWYKNDGESNNTSFIVKDITGTLSNISSVNVADINGDGYDDIISTSKDNGEIYWHQNEGGENPSFSTRYTIVSDLTSLNYASGVDMDNDGDIDILSNSSEIGGKIVWYENIGEDATFHEHIVATGQDYVIRVFAADTDNDGNMDVIAGQADGNITYYENIHATIIKKVPKTGQTTSYNYEDDGDLKKGETRDYTRENDHVIDNHTGLMWHDDANVSSMTINWQNATRYCKDSTLDSYDDWRVPTPLELMFIVDKGKDTPPAIDDTFLNTNTTKNYWTNLIEKNNSDNVYTINFEYGKDLERDSKFIPRNIRCVRGHSIKSNFQRDDENQVVNDITRKLTWQDNADVTTKKKWTDAIDHCLSKGVEWRLPNIFELFTIVDHSKRNDTTHNIFQQKEENKKYWSSTTDLEDIEKARSIDFEIGHDWNSGKNDYLYIRCVKDMP